VWNKQCFQLLKAAENIVGALIHSLRDMLTLLFSQVGVIIVVLEGLQEVTEYCSNVNNIGCNYYGKCRTYKNS
jgi:hypothetical protein